MNGLTTEQKEFWVNNSYLVLRSFFDPEREKLSKWVDQVAAWPDAAGKWLRFFERTNRNQLSRVENFVPYHEGLAEALTGQRIIDLMSELMGDSAILYKDRINFKYPGGGPHSAHQDGVAYDQPDNGTFSSAFPPYLSLLISVDGASEQTGCFEVVGNWDLEKSEILPLESPDADCPQFTKICQAVEDELDWISIPTDPGDAIVFTERLPHRSKANFSGNPRRILYGVYNPSSEGDRREQYFSTKRKDPNNSRYMIGNPHTS